MLEFAMTYWGWLVAGLIMLVVELLAPFAFFLWLGVAAFCTALLIILIPDISWQAQVLTFAVLSVVSVVVSRRYISGNKVESELPNLNRRAAQYVGRTAIICEAIKNGEGKLSIDDSRWKASGPDFEEGTKVRIVSVDGSVLSVEAITNGKN